MTSERISIYSTFPDQPTAERITRTLVEEGLVACANLFGIDSVYRWQGAVETATECAALLKTRQALYQAVEDRIRQLHPYEVPAIVAYPIVAGHAEYLRWIDESTRPAAP
jgi:periplasmic divalent cation tolerance protein